MLIKVQKVEFKFASRPDLIKVIKQKDTKDKDIEIKDIEVPIFPDESAMDHNQELALKKDGALQKKS